MSDDTHTERDEEFAEEAGDAREARPSPGELLRSARESKGLSVDELVAQTLLSRSTVAALEANDFERLSQPVFVRGYYRKCAKVLGLPEDELMAAYAEYTGVPGPRPASPGQVDVIPQDVTPRSWRALRVILLVIAVLAVAAAAWWLIPRLGGDYASTDVLEDGFQRSLLTAPDAAAGRAAPASDLADDTAEGVAGMRPAEESPQPSSEPVAESAPANGPVGSAGDAGARLELRFRERSWVEVRDADGKRLLGGILPAGSERSLTGRPPYQVALGNAPGVDIRFNGEAVAIGDEIRDNNTARFTLAADAGE